MNLATLKILLKSVVTEGDSVSGKAIFQYNERGKLTRAAFEYKASGDVAQEITDYGENSVFVAMGRLISLSASEDHPNQRCAFIIEQAEFIKRIEKVVQGNFQNSQTTETKTANG